MQANNISQKIDTIYQDLCQMETQLNVEMGVDKDFLELLKTTNQLHETVKELQPMNRTGSNAKMQGINKHLMLLQKSMDSMKLDENKN